MKTNRKLKTALPVKRYHHTRSTLAGRSELLPSDVIDFALLPAHRDFWRETVLLLDDM